MAFDYMHPPEDFEYLGEWCKAWRDPATGDWTISQLLDGLDTEQIILSGEEVRELARLAAQHDPTDYELEYGELRRPMFASPDENGTAVNAAEGAGGEQAMVQAAAKQGVRLKGLSEYYMQDAAHCRPDTVVAGYSGLQAEDIPAAAAALGRAWRQMSHPII